MAPIANLTVRISAQIAELEKGFATANQKLDDFGKQSQRVAGIAKAAGAAIAGAFTLDAVIGFGRELVEMADEIQRVADRTGLATGEVQKLSYIAEQSGNSIDELTGAIGLMQKHIGDPKFQSALSSIGISFEQFRTQSPFQQIGQIASAFKNVKDPADQARLAFELFGRSGIAIIPTLISDFDRLSKQAPVAADNTIKALDQFGDAMNRFRQQIKVWAAESYNFLSRMMDAQIALIMRAIGSFFDATAGIVELAQKIPGAGKALDVLGVSVDSLRGKAQYYRDAAKAMAYQTGEFGNAARKTVPQISDFSEETGKATKTVDAHARAIQALADKYSGAALAKQVRDLSEAIKLLKPGADLKVLAEDIGKLFKEGAKLTPEMIQIGIAFDTLLPKVRQGTDGFDDLGWSISGVSIPAKRFSELLPEVERGIGDVINEFAKADLSYQFTLANKPLKETKDHIDELARALSQLAQISGDSFGSVVRSIGGIVSAIDVATKGAKSLNDGFKSISSGETLAGLAGVATGLAGIATAGISIGKSLQPLLGLRHGKLGELLGTNASGRSLVNDFAELMGGYDALHEKLLALGDAGEALWIKLTQGVGRANAQQAQAAIDEVTAALEEQENQQGDTQAATEEQAQATIETASQAAQALDELGDKLRTNEDDWARWSDTVTGDIQQIADALRALNIPSPGASSGGGGGEEAPGASTGGIMSAGRIIASHFGTGGIAGRLVQFSPRGADRYPAMLADGEGVLNRRAMAALGAANLHALNSGRLSTLGSGIDASAGPMQSVAILEVDGREFARAMVPVYPGETRRYGVRVRAS